MRKVLMRLMVGVLLGAATCSQPAYAVAPTSEKDVGAALVELNAIRKGCETAAATVVRKDIESARKYAETGHVVDPARLLLYEVSLFNTRYATCVDQKIGDDTLLQQLNQEESQSL
jgi:hypothetical protein